MKSVKKLYKWCKDFLQFQAREIKKHIGMENKKHITVFDIPLGMSRSVENGQMFFPAHPVRDASLTGCRFCMVLLRFTERYIPNGMKFEISIILNL